MERINGKNARLMIAAAVLAGLLSLQPRTVLAQCENPATSAPPINALLSAELGMIPTVEAKLTPFWTTDFATATTDMAKRIKEFTDEIRDVLADWWNDNMLPSMKLATSELATARPDQSMIRGNFVEAASQVKTQMKFQEKTVEQERRLRLSDHMCPVATAAPALAENERMSRAVATALSMEDSPRRRGQQGSVSANGRGGERQAQWKTYRDTFCDPDENNGNAGCATKGLLAGQDTDVNSLLWGEKQTIDFATGGVGTDNKLVADTAIQNMLSPVTPEPLPPAALATPEGRREMMRRRSLEARQRTAYNAMARILGTRTGGVARPEAAAVRMAALNPSDPSVVSSNPSYKELMDAMVRDRYRQPDYLIKLVDEPEAIIREQGNIKSLQLQQMNEIYKRMEELLVLKAAELGQELDENGGDGVHQMMPIQ